MHIWAKRIFMAATPLLLTGCLWGPGKFTSELALKKDGSFVLDYRGEIMLQLPDEARRTARVTPWSDDKARCFVGVDASNPPDDLLDEGGASAPKARPCTKAEIARQKSNHEKNEAERAAREQDKSDKAARALGLPGFDDESNRAFAAKIMKYAGWRSVTYRGNGVYDVDYHFEGHLTQDYAFPMLPDADMMVPFIALRRRADGSVLMTAPAFAGGNPFAGRAKALDLPDSDDGMKANASGRFTVTTDAEILTNNSEDGPVAAPAGRRMHWDVTPNSTKVPEALVRL